MNFLFIHPLGEDIHIHIIGDNPEQYSLSKHGDIAEDFPLFLNNIVWHHTIDEIWCIHGPGPFTLMRIITLSVNTLAFVKNIPLKSCHFFDIIQWDAILEINREEYLIRKDWKIHEISQNTLEPWEYHGYVARKDFTENQRYIEYIEDLDYISAVFWMIEPTHRISPTYFKPPHITWSKKNTSHSSEKTSH